jgi:uncharacterized protein HemX
MKVTDMVLVLAQIEKLELSLPEWRLKQHAEPVDAEADVPPSGIWNRLKASLGSLVTVRKQNQPMLTLEEIDWLRERMRGYFQAARLAALHGDQGLYDKALKQLMQLQAEHFEMDDEQNSEARMGLQQLSAVTLRPDPPESTRALRELRLLGIGSGSPAPRPGEQAENTSASGGTDTDRTQ